MSPGDQISIKPSSFKTYTKGETLELAQAGGVWLLMLASTLHSSFTLVTSDIYENNWREAGLDKNMLTTNKRKLATVPTWVVIDPTPNL